MATTLKVKVGERWFTVEVHDLDANPVRVLVDGEPVMVDIGQQFNDGQVPFPEAGSTVTPVVAMSPAAERPAQAPAEVSAPAETRPASSGSPTAAARPASARKSFFAPMPGVILSVSVNVGDTVVTGDEVCVLEAMKMQQTLRCDWSGVVKEVHVQPGQQVLGGDPIVDLE